VHKRRPQATRKPSAWGRNKFRLEAGDKSPAKAGINLRLKAGNKSPAKAGYKYMAQLSEWLQLMLAEIVRKREDSDRAREEQQARERESTQPLNDSPATRR
jgi:hypothetical protein